MFRCTASGLAIPPSIFVKKNSAQGFRAIILEDHLEANLGLGKVFFISIWDKAHTVPSSGPAYWASQEAVHQFGPIATIFKRVMEGLVQKSRSRTKKNNKRREQEPIRHEKECNECGERRFLCIRGLNGGRSLCLDCGLTWLRQQPLSGSIRCTECGNGWGVSKVWLTGQAGKNTICKNCYTRWDEYKKAVAYAGKEANEDEQGNKEDVHPAQ
ncbi:hypothetical protein E8E11_007211 [Didymella keratinophila]|nr:hypothetical protein E8E11_007211 [Didymella keratinophila]